MSTAEVALSPIRNGPVILPDFIIPESTFTMDESILVYITLPESVIPMRILKSDSIESLKMRIQSCQGFFVRNQKLVCGGRELSRSETLVREYGITNGNVLHLVLRLSDLQALEIKTATGNAFTLYVERGRDVAYVKQQIADKEFDDLDNHEVVCDGELLDDKRLINDLCKNNNDAVIHLLVRRTAKVRAKPVEKHFEVSIVADKNPNCQIGSPKQERILLEPIVVNSKTVLPSAVLDMVNETHEGLQSGKAPIRSMEGTGGAYFMQDSSGQKLISVFKPADEEPMAKNNPRGLPLSSSGEGLKKGTRVGEGALREVAAYILDHPKSGRRGLFPDEEGFSGVPPTAMVKCWHAGFNHQEEVSMKIGSLQKFMENNGSCEDVGPAGFPVQEVHKISVLDIRLANADRHAGNILMRKDGEDGRTHLIPIDHGYCLPESFEDCTFDWLYWPQARQPYDGDTVEYVKSLDADEDIALLKFHGWNVTSSCSRVLQISTMLLKKGVEKGLTAYTIGSLMCRETLTKKSVIEEIVEEATGPSPQREDEFLQAVSRIMDRRLHDIANSW